ncbi:integrase [Tannerella sp. oral taxon BU063 isolate Cell 1/3]|uniref:Integrase n=1 Tax=Tannerella sp. oral taxon BU063 isolate Cell 1/3 TaxID=1411022 RepID=W2CL55_9BACT|nr:integrase [Tannerella sp. oral taxon BU063 isolate Cell 1/3]
MRSTFRLLFYINRNKAKKNGKAAVLCRITVDGRSAVIATGEECAPETWQTKSGETGDRKINLRLQALRERIEASYTTLLRREGVVSVERLKLRLQGVNETPTMLLETSTEELRTVEACVGRSRSPGTYQNNRRSDSGLRDFVRSRGESDIPIPTLAPDFFDAYRFFLKRRGYAASTTNRYLHWLGRLMRRAIARGVIRFNPFEGVRYETEKYRPRFLQKHEVERLLAFPVRDEATELSRRMFLFSVFTGLAYADLRTLRRSQIETDGAGRPYIRKARQKTHEESLIPLHPIAEQLLSLYLKDDKTEDRRIFPDASYFLLTHRLKAIGKACGLHEPLTFHVGRHSFGTLTLEAGISMESIARMMGHASVTTTELYARITDQKISEDVDRLIARRRKAGEGGAAPGNRMGKSPEQGA